MKAPAIAPAAKADPVWDFAGSANLFSSALTDVLQAELLREVAGSQLSFSQLKLLQLLSLVDTRTISELAAFLGVSHAAASKMVDKLVQAGWLSRATRATDRRTAQVSLTTRSRRLVTAYEEKRRQKLAKVFRGHAARELRRVAKLLDQITATIVNHNNRPDQICLHCGIYFRDKCLVRDLGGRNCLYQKRTRRRRTGPASARE